MNIHDELILDFDNSPLDALASVSEFADQPHRVRFDGLELPEGIASIASRMARDTWPLPPTKDRENYGGPRHLTYWLAGLRDYLFYAQTAQKFGVTLGPASRSLDLGCSTGRVLRHFRFQGEHGELWGADLNVRNVRWMQQFLPHDLKVFNNHWLPQLPIEDNFFDLIHAVSVFTHIDQFESGWLLELRRVLKPGGLMIQSVHTDVTWGLMGDDREREEIPLYNALVRRGQEIQEMVVTPDTFKSPMPAPRVVMTFKGRTMYHCNTFHSHEYLRREWGRWFKVEAIVPRGVDPHDAIVLRKL